MQKQEISLRKRLNMMVIFVGVMLSLFLAIFFFHTFHNVYSSTETRISEVTNRIVSDMDHTFSTIDQTTASISSLSETKQLLDIQDPFLYTYTANHIRDILDSIYEFDGLVEHILLFDTNGMYSQLRGNLKETMSSSLYESLQTADSFEHNIFKLDDKFFIAYKSSILVDSEKMSYLIFLIDCTELSNIFQNYGVHEDFLITMEIHDMIIADNHSLSAPIGTSFLYEKEDIYIKHQIGSTPYYITISNVSVIRSTFLSFLWIIIIGIVILIGIILYVYRFLQKTFFEPMFSLIDSAARVGIVTQKLDYTGQPEFDKLVDQVNGMLVNIEENNSQLLEMQAHMQRAELETQKTVMISLKKQISAHFTVNTINVIKRLYELGEHEKSREMCDGLAFILRYANDAEDMIPCMDEIFVLEKYLQIMHIRYPDRFVTVYDIADDIYDELLPRMLLQPIVENAIVYGFVSDKQGELTIRACVDGNNLVFSIIDNGAGMTLSQLSVLRENLKHAPSQAVDDAGLNHIALLNIQKRVVSMFGREYGLVVDSVVGTGTEVKLVLPTIGSV